VQQQEDPDRGGDRDAQHPLPRALTLGGRAQHLRVVLQREADAAQALPDVAGDRGERAPVDARGDVEVAGDGVVADDGRVRRDPHAGHVAQAHLAAARPVDQHVLDAGQAVAGGGLAPHDHVEDLLVLEQVADGDARQQGGRGATDVARLDPVALRASRSTVISTVGSVAWGCTCGETTPATPAIAAATAAALARSTCWSWP
jgi:hypothetical protein